MIDPDVFEEDSKETMYEKVCKIYINIREWILKKIGG